MAGIVLTPRSRQASVRPCPLMRSKSPVPSGAGRTVIGVSTPNCSIDRCSSRWLSRSRLRARPSSGRIRSTRTCWTLGGCPFRPLLALTPAPFVLVLPRGPDVYRGSTSLVLPLTYIGVILPELTMGTRIEGRDTPTSAPPAPRVGTCVDRTLGGRQLTRGRKESIEVRRELLEGFGVSAEAAWRFDLV